MSRPTLFEIIGSLMLSDNLGDVHESIDELRALVGVPPLEGNYLEGWTDTDWASINNPYGGEDGQ